MPVPPLLAMLFGTMLCMLVPTAPFLVLVVLTPIGIWRRNHHLRVRGDRRGDGKNQSKYQGLLQLLPLQHICVFATASLLGKRGFMP